jgi:hypothetical protein
MPACVLRVAAPDSKLTARKKLPLAVLLALSSVVCWLVPTCVWFVLPCRDDLIFLIYLYQRYIYRVDMTRVNEFGFSGQQQAEVEAAKAAAEAANGAAASDAVPALEVRRHA